MPELTIPIVYLGTRTEEADGSECKLCGEPIYLSMMVASVLFGRAPIVKWKYCQSCYEAMVGESNL